MADDRPRRAAEAQLAADLEPAELPGRAGADDQLLHARPEHPAAGDAKPVAQPQPNRLDPAQGHVGAGALARPRHLGDDDELAAGERQAVGVAGDGLVLLYQRGRADTEEARKLAVAAAAGDH